MLFILCIKHYSWKTLRSFTRLHNGPGHKKRLGSPRLEEPYCPHFWFCECMRAWVWCCIRNVCVWRWGVALQMAHGSRGMKCNSCKVFHCVIPYWRWHFAVHLSPRVSRRQQNVCWLGAERQASELHLTAFWMCGLKLTGEPFCILSVKELNSISPLASCNRSQKKREWKTSV